MALNESIGKHEEGMEQGNRIFREDSLDFNCIIFGVRMPNVSLS
jgi:hypothetical protein